MSLQFPATAYQAFMAGYVRRINQATLDVEIGGIRIGSAKFSRLAQINLKSKVITFSRFAIENVPERGRRYLVIHELSHVREPSHNKRFWDIVGTYEPNYRQVGRELELAFKRNVREELLGRRDVGMPPKLLLSTTVANNLHLSQAGAEFDCQPGDDPHEHEEQEGFSCTEEGLGSWSQYEPGIMCGGYQTESVLAVE